VLAACRNDIAEYWSPEKAYGAGLAGLLVASHACELEFVPAFDGLPPAAQPVWFSFLFELPDVINESVSAGRYAAYARAVCAEIGKALAQPAGGSPELTRALLSDPTFGLSFHSGRSLGDILGERSAAYGRLLESKVELQDLRVAAGGSGHSISAERPLAPPKKKPRAAAATGASAIDDPEKLMTERIFATGIAHHQQGRVAEAISAYREVLKRNPDHGGVLNNLGLLESDLNHFDEAERCFRRAMVLEPKNANAVMNLGNLFKARGKNEEAIAYFRQAIAIEPDHATSYVNMGNVLQHLGRVDEAIATYQKALEIDSQLPDAHLNMGNILSRTNRSEEAVLCFERALALKPDFPAAHNNLGLSLVALGRHDRAVTCFEQAMRYRPNYLDAFLNIGSLYKDLGEGEKAAEYYERILAIDPDHPGALSNISFSLNYSGTVEAKALARQHFRSGAQIERKYVPAPRTHANVRDPGRKLRIGYVSPDFRFHAVTNFFEPLIRAHDRNVVELTCYAEVLTPDAMTAKLKGMADHWVSTIGLSDDEMADRIRADGIDILVDMAGHSSNNRLAVFARKPAPVQVTWLGYPNTTGLTNIDYRFVDEVSDPPGVADTLASETLVRLDGGFLCYNTFIPAPDPAPPPCLKTKNITFGSFNNLPKLSPIALDTWSTLLKRVPGARLVLKNRFLGEPGTCDLMLRRFAERGIDSDRIVLRAGIPDLTAHMGAYHEVDIGLDSFPYNGTTTTCEALWMGIPVIGLAGDRHLARVGASILTYVGAPELVARDEGHYIDLAIELAQDIPRLKAYHDTLRPRMKASPLCDPVRFARRVEEAYREMWQRWCQGLPAEKKPAAAP
jgi:predicted O-linked N-acetylglucosamine transferase (SPINDLY family)